MRDELVGYLIDALDPDERSALETQLARDPALKQDLNVLRRGLDWLDCSRQHFEPPRDLTQRTCHFVQAQVNTTLAPAAPSATRWRMADLVVVAGIFVAASMLFIPAISHSRYAARLAGCENNLRRIGQAMAQYSGLHNGHFPGVAQAGRQSAAGIYAVKLMDQGLIDEPQWFVCPGSSLAEKAKDFHIPSLKELESASEEKLAELERAMGGSYGYNLGYVDKAGYHPPRDLHRKNFALVADAPQVDGAHPRSLNHGGWGHNVLYEDGHVNYLENSSADGSPDNIFLNDKGRIAAGTHRDDAVIGPSAAHPLPITPVSNSRGR